jgi:(S)-3,5-dihydroxyphenylglycine transaminase
MSKSSVTTTAPSRLAVMNFLNEVADDYPNAISFASGRPAENFFELDDWLGAIPRFQRHLTARRGADLEDTGRWLAQYGRTNGLINDLVAAQLQVDEGVPATPERVVVTAGCQEALALCMHALCKRPGDVVLARCPTYIGVTGVADLAGISLHALDEGGDELAAQVRHAAQALAAQGRRARALYLIPEFDNPTGSVLPRAAREAVLAACAELGIVILEDNPYGMFRFDGEREPPLAALDDRGVVIYLGTYSKTLCPAVRVGCAVLPPTLFGDAAASAALLAELGERKSFLTVNTSQINQALVGGVLLAEQGSLARLVAAPLTHYRRNRDALVDALALHFRGTPVRWNRPAGGFFLTVDLPFAFERREVLRCAGEYRVIPMPMTFFSLGGGHRRRVRLAFSNQTPESIAAGVERFASFVHDHMEVAS